MKSPDNLDAAVYACAEIDALINNPYAELEVGSMVSYDPWELMEMDDRRGMPI